MRYEVQTLIGANLSGAWVNVWAEESIPLTFATPAEAESEIFDFLNECKAAGMPPPKLRIRPASA